MAKPKLLIVEDDEGLCGQYRWAFPAFEVFIAHARAEGLAIAAAEKPEVVITDLGLPPDEDGVTEGFAVLEGTQRVSPTSKVIVATGNNARAHALRAVGQGAYDFCEKPVDIEVLRTIVDRGLRLGQLEAENHRLADDAPTQIKRIVTAAEPMLKVCRTIERLAPTSVSVLLLGESGTGKEALARALHELGPRAKQPYVALNCGAIPENLLESELFGHERGAFTGAVRQQVGRIESANKGTLFLDEVGDLPHPLQVKLLRFLQDQVIERVGGRQSIQVDVRIVSATNQTLEAQVDDGRFRADLFYRLNSVTVRIPPLRERPGDPLLLARFFLGRFSREFNRALRGFDPEAVEAILAHHWPGNVRELENRVKRAVVMAEGKMVEAADLELAAAPRRAGSTVADSEDDLDLRAARTRAEHAVLQKALARSGGTLAAAAKLLGISRPTLYTLLEAHGLSAEAGRGLSLPDDAA